MASKFVPETQEDTGPPLIIIERRIRVAEIHHDPHGIYSPLQAAFLAAGQAMEESLTLESGDNLEFTYGEHRFTLGAEPVKYEDATR